jgi:hypothetical protein
VLVLYLDAPENNQIIVVDDALRRAHRCAIAGTVLFVFCPLVIIGFIVYRFVVEYTRNGSDDAITLDLNRTTPSVNRNAPNKSVDASGGA